MGSSVADSQANKSAASVRVGVGGAFARQVGEKQEPVTAGGDVSGG